MGDPRMNKKAYFIVLITCVLTLQTVNAINITETDNQPRSKPFAFTYNSFIQLEYDPDLLNEGILPGGPPVHVPLTIKYHTDIPDKLLHSPLFRIKQCFLFGTFYQPLQKIQISVLNEPDWGTIFIANPKIDVRVDYDEVTTDLVIAVHSDAPAEPYNLQLKVEVPAIKRLKGKEMNYNLNFAAKYMPNIDVFSEQIVVLALPNQTEAVPIEITNLGNYWTIVNSEIITNASGWSISIDPDQIEIAVDETNQVTLQFIPPEDFYGIQPIELMFTPSGSPPYHEETGDPVTIVIVAYYF